MSSLICDFCSQPNPTMAYPCRDFGITRHSALKPDAETHLRGGFTWANPEDLAFEPSSAFRSIGAWAACDACHTLITHNRIEALAQRSLSLFPQQVSTPSQALDDLRLSVLLFLDLRNGPALPIHDYVPSPRERGSAP